MPARKRVAVLFGGQSAEHDVSLMSARNVVAAIDTSKFDIVPIAITRSGEWFAIEEGIQVPDAVPGSGTRLSLLPGGRGRLLALPESGPAYELPPVDVVFPVLHGLFGEDGSVQGYAEVAGVPFVGCGILGSAAAMDKDIAKALLAQAGLNVAHAVTLRRGEEASFERIAQTLGLPVFVKPARLGSSIGVGKARTAAEFATALENAFAHDEKVLVEEFLDGREIEFGVLELEDGTLTVSLPGEIAPAESHGFYSFDAKYVDADGAALQIPAPLPEGVTAELQALALRAFRALACEGMARVDFFVRADLSVFVNEVNTIPGFTNISMYPKVFGASGIGYPQLIEKLIGHALARAKRALR